MDSSNLLTDVIEVNHIKCLCCHFVCSVWLLISLLFTTEAEIITALTQLSVIWNKHVTYCYHTLVVSIESIDQSYFYKIPFNYFLVIFLKTISLMTLMV